MDDFVKFPKIEQIGKLFMTVTQKIHGSNGQIYIKDLSYLKDMSIWSIQAGSRTRWLEPDDDNHGFCKWVYANQEALVAALGAGRHYGEWCGKGINAGEGLSDKMFVLFDWWSYGDKEKYPYHPYIADKLALRVVPVLYSGKFSMEIINGIMADLKANGSRLTPSGWYMKPEGIVIDINGQKFKRVFDDETVAWKKKTVTRSSLPIRDVSHLLQPLRLSKLLSSDERYTRTYPESLKEIAKAYYDDLIAEDQITGDEDEVRAIKKSLGSELYKFIRDQVENKE